jgi:hemoglobin
MNSESSLYERLGGHDGILKLLKPFYADVRQHAVIGPIFTSHVTDWNSHLAKITEFWALQTGGPSAYRGGFAGAHLPLGLRPEHFEHWLGLWELNSARQLPPREAKEMIALAQEFGRRLRAVTQRTGTFSLRAAAFPKAGHLPG